MLVSICVIFLFIIFIGLIIIISQHIKKNTRKTKILSWLAIIIFIISYSTSLILLSNWISRRTKEDVFIDKYNTAKELMRIEKDPCPQVNEIITGINDEINYHKEKRKNIWTGKLYSKKISELEPLDLP